jgi:hypothetical protein
VPGAAPGEYKFFILINIGVTNTFPLQRTIKPLYAPVINIDFVRALKTGVPVFCISILPTLDAGYSFYPVVS